MILGQAVRIIDVLKKPTGVTITDSVITITDPRGNVVVNRGEMTQEATNVYTYVYSSEEGGTEGEYSYVITYTTDALITDKVKGSFRLETEENA